MKKFTKKESQVMDILWSEGKPLTAREISDRISEMSVYSVQQVLSRLLEGNIIQVAGITHNRNAIARQYEPSMQEADYLASIANSRETCRRFAQNFVDAGASLEELNELEARIRTRIRELKDQSS
ncbi:BlaI/MecI/CopY family transcriptional regulator [Faecalibaculum rodentium]|uniref:BlaI/MecI/CopY family transcriptional regulator n=1 Tax=Faecalibaculum rodentium TaxID=1702221 RepID=UPI0023F2FB18|nr:BlaI/MecI/CopY family transcriptional regulator [Faecalibaculum rodentium]